MSAAIGKAGNHLTVDTSACRCFSAREQRLQMNNDAGSITLAGPGRPSRKCGDCAASQSAALTTHAVSLQGRAFRGSGTDHKLRRMAPDTTRVLLLAADLFEDMELLYPLYRLQEEGISVTVAGLDRAAVTGKKGHGPVDVDAAVDEVAESDFAALVIPGGFAPDKLRRSAAVLDLVRAFDRSKKPIAFICHAGWVPISAGILKGRRATSVGAIRDDMVNAGVDWVDREVVVDRNLISARTPADLGPWMKALLSAVGDQK